MNQPADPHRRNWSLYAAALVAYAAVFTIAMLRPSPASLRAWYAVLLTAFGALLIVQRHAQASQAWLVLTTDDGHVTLVVSDDGVGLRSGADKSGFGLRGLQERAGQLGGEFHVDARPGGGTQVHFSLPIAGQDPGKRE
jgi:signal transduction histidine kinase